MLDQAGLFLMQHRDVRDPAGDPVVGLSRGDGLVWGTRNRRDRVRELQRRLNAATLAGLSLDGKFGRLTTAALHTFQLQEELPLRERVDAATAKRLKVAPMFEDETPLSDAGLALARAALIVGPTVPLLAGAGHVLKRGRPSDTNGGPAGDQLVNASKRFLDVSNALNAAGTDLQAI